MRDSPPMPIGRHLRRSVLGLTFGLVSLGGALLPTGTVWAESAHPGALVVTIDPGSSGLDPAAIRATIARELGVEVVDAPVAGAGGTMTIEIRGQNSLEMSFVNTDGWVNVTRSLELPSDSEHQLEAIALLGGNLARNQAGELLAGLVRKETPPSEPPYNPPKPLPPKPVPIRRELARPPPVPEPRRAPSPCELARAELRSVRPFNLSLAYPLATNSDSVRHQYRGELGLAYSRVGGVSGAGLNPVYLRVDGPMLGGAVGGVLTQLEGPVCGGTIAGVGDFGHGPLTGFEIGGAYAIRLGSVQGLQLASAFSMARDFSGLQISGVAAYDRGSLTGGQIAGALGLVEGDVDALAVVAGASIVTGKLRGGQVAGLVAHADGSVNGVQIGGVYSYGAAHQGVQIAGAFNRSAALEGVQIGGLYNHSADVDGVQIGIVNYAHRVRGVQIGVVNMSRHVDGIALGLVNVATEGRTQLVAWGDGPARGNLGVKYLFGPVYSLLAVGVDVEPATAASTGIGLHLPAGRWFADLDVLYSFVGDQYLKGVQRYHVRNEFRYRAMLGVELIPRGFGVFGGAALEHGVDSDGVNLGARPEAVAGMQVF